MARSTPATLPHSTDAERTVLGAILLDPEKMVDVAPLLSTGDFYDPVHAAIYEAMKKLYDQRRPVDFLTVAQALEADGAIAAVGGSGFLAELANDVPTASHGMTYAEIVREKSLRRQLAKAGRKIAELTADEGRTAGDLLEQAEHELLKLSRQSVLAKPESIGDLAAGRYDDYAQLHDQTGAPVQAGIKTGFPDLDRMLEGLEPGHLMILAGRPSMGKTALALNMAANVARQGKTAAFFSLEMTQRQITDRLIAGIAGVEASRLKKGTLADDAFQRVGRAMDRITNFPIFVDDCPDATLPALRSKARRQQMEHGLDCLIVDYLGLIQVTDRAAGENQTQRISFISRSLKSLARELQCPLIALSQLSRACEQRTPPIPILSDLRDSGAIEQDADSVLMLYREGEYNPDCEDPRLTEVYVRKNRDGATGRADLIFHKDMLSFASVDRIHQASTASPG